MFSVSLLYSSRDFLKLNSISGMSPETFESYFSSFKYSTSDKILTVSFKCGWAKVNQQGKIELTERGQEISTFDYQSALLLQLEDLILNFNPTWASLLIKGRTEAKNFLPADALQCFKECGLFGQLTDELIQFWDKLSLAYRNYSQKRMTEIGRAGEKLSFDYEFKRTGKSPLWQAVESNLAGFDLLSIINNDNSQKLKIEVKTTTSKIAYSKFHITKNEWNTALASINYIFHLWNIEKTPVLYTVPLDKISEHIPKDKGYGDWEAVEIPFEAVI
ncbi:MAG: DUF3883 domain-containing protein [Bacteroidota bacterium]|nr:DUF3883 domain-containing protein [Bacteroidota bacterium]